MSAKSVAGPGGKKPASAATNLIGEFGLGLCEEYGLYWLCTNALAKLVEVLV